jgi:hypothetical protein
VQPLSKILEWENISLRIKELINLGYETIYYGQISERNQELIISGYEYFFSFALFLLTLLTIIYILKYNKNPFFIKIIFYFIFVTFFVFMYMLTTSFPFLFARYYFMTSVLYLIILGIAKNESMRYRFWWTPLISIIVFAAILLNQIDIYKVNKRAGTNETTKNLRKVALYLQKEKFNIVEASYWNAGVLKSYSNGYINTKHWGHGTNLAPFIWLTDKSLYREYQNTPTILLTTDNEELNFNETSKSRLLTGEKLTKIGEFNLYKFDGAQLSLIEFPNISGESIEYTFQNWQWLFNAKINFDNKSIITEPSGGFFFGPYIFVKNGIYDFILDYEVILSTSDIVGEFKVTTDIGTNTLTKLMLTNSDKRIAIKDVHFKNSNSIEVLGLAYNGNIIEFKKIIITKK